MRTSRLVPMLAALIVTTSACTLTQPRVNSAGIAFHEGHGHEIRDPWMLGDSVPVYRPNSAPHPGPVAYFLVELLAVPVAQSLARCNSIVCWQWGLPGAPSIF